MLIRLPKYTKKWKLRQKKQQKNCKTDYEKITTITDYVHSVMTYDISKSHVVWSMEDAWNTKTGGLQTNIRRLWRE